MQTPSDALPPPSPGSGDAPPPADDYARLPLVGAVVKFNLKLLLNGLVDMLLVPASLVALGLGIAMGGDEPDRYFRELMRVGRRFEHWLNLFGNRARMGVDGVLDAYERQVADEFERRGWSRTAEAALRRSDLAQGRAPGVDADAMPQAPPSAPPSASPNAGDAHDRRG